MRKSLYKAQRIQGYKCKFRVHKEIIFKGRTICGFFYKITDDGGMVCRDCKCPMHRMKNQIRVRHIRGLPEGREQVFIEATFYRYRCPKCHAKPWSHYNFIPYPGANVTRLLFERIVEDLDGGQNIKSCAKRYGLAESVVRSIHIRHLEKAYAHKSLRDVSKLSIDEICIFHKHSQDNRYLTIARDLDSGRVLEVVPGKGASVLDAFARRLRRQKANIQLVCMDMSNSYISWVNKWFPESIVSYDRFHVIKSLNDKLDAVRRKYTKDLTKEELTKVKNLRFLFLMNGEDIQESPRKGQFEKALNMITPLSKSYHLKERFRLMYSIAKDIVTANQLFDEWIKNAKESEVPQMEVAAKTFSKHKEGILAYWKAGHYSNASMEGFNSKIRMLIKTAYGFRNREYLMLRIYALPTLKVNKVFEAA